MPAAPRPYHQVARAEATRDARRRIIDTFMQMLAETSLAEITLDALAARAGSTRQTVIRYFGGKDGMMQALGERMSEEVRERRAVRPDATLDEHIAALVADYEEVGDMIVQLLAQEVRLPSLRIWLDVGRSGHREWIADLFAPWLDKLPPGERSCLLDQLYAATDVNTWKLFRRDFGHSAETTAALIADIAKRLVAAA